MTYVLFTLYLCWEYLDGSCEGTHFVVCEGCPVFGDGGFHSLLPIKQPTLHAPMRARVKNVAATPIGIVIM